MARLAGVDLPAKKRTEIGLTYIYGIGRTRANSLCYRAGVNPDTKIADLTEEEVNKIRQILEAEGAVEGQILAAPRGNGGFGYDPLFYLPGLQRTMAEIDDQARWTHSHRGEAFRSLLNLIGQHEWPALK